MARDSAKMTATRKVAPTHFWLCNMMAATALTMVCQPPSQETKAEAGEKERPHRLRRGRSRSGFLGLSVATEAPGFHDSLLLFHGRTSVIPTTTTR